MLTAKAGRHTAAASTAMTNVLGDAASHNVIGCAIKTSQQKRTGEEKDDYRSVTCADSVFVTVLDRIQLNALAHVLNFMSMQAY